MTSKFGTGTVSANRMFLIECSFSLDLQKKPFVEMFLLFEGVTPSLTNDTICKFKTLAIILPVVLYERDTLKKESAI